MNLIDRYILGLATQDEIAYVERRMSDPDFYAHFTFIQSTRRTAQAHEEALLREEFRKIKPQQNKKPNSGLSILLWTIILTGIVIGGYLLYKYYSADTTNPEQLYAEFYSPMPNLVAPIEQGAPDTLISAMPFRSYERGDYAKAIQWFELHGIDRPESRFYYGLSLLAGNRAAEAVTILEQSAAQDTSEFSQAAQWYLALAFLRTGDLHAARRVLMSIISNPAHRYRSDAIGLQSYLD